MAESTANGRFVREFNLLFYLRVHSFDIMSSSYLVLKGYFRFVIYSECIQLAAYVNRREKDQYCND